MEVFLIKALQLILSLSLLVFIHELGHFGFARLFKTRVDKFYLFFNPSYSLVRWKKVNGKWQVKWLSPNLPDHLEPIVDAYGEAVLDKKGKPLYKPASLDVLEDDDWRKYPENTEWGIGWLPLGGYCKIAGMVDESMDTANMSAEPEPWEYRSKKTWQRFLIIVAGVINNFIGAVLIYSMMMYTWGESYVQVPNATLGYNYCQTALDNGFENGDRILTIDGKAIYKESEVSSLLVIDKKTNIELIRQNDTISLQLPVDFSQQMIAASERQFMALRIPFVINNVQKKSPAAVANLQSGDSIVGINGVAMSSFTDVSSILKKKAGDTIQIKVARANSYYENALIVSQQGTIGVQLNPLDKVLKVDAKDYGFWQSFPAGWKKGVSVLGSYIKQFKLVASKEGVKHLGGFGAIGSLFPAQWDWIQFWSMTALLSVILAFMNILPIPVLDGGYALMLIYEMVTGRKPSDKFVEVSVTIGMILLFGLMIFANLQDILRLF